MAPLRTALPPEPVSPELALVDPILRRQLLAALGRPPVESTPAPVARAIQVADVPRGNRAGGRHAQERLGYVVAGVALTIGCAIGLVSTLPHHGTTNAPSVPAPIATSAGQAATVVTWSKRPPAVVAPAKSHRQSKAPVRLDPFVPPDSADALPSTTSNAR